jgi:hypothetical protein
VAAVGYSIVFYVAVLYTRGGAKTYAAHPLSLNGSRYTIVPLTLLYSALIIAAGIPASRAAAAPRPRVGDPVITRSLSNRLAVPLLPFAAALLVLVQLGFNYAPEGPRTSGVSWRTGVASARAGCQAHLKGPSFPGPSTSPLLRPRFTRGIVQIPQPPITPSWFWAVRLRCSQLS